jgi:outer membrane protein assembly factor BamB
MFAISYHLPLAHRMSTLRNIWQSHPRLVVGAGVLLTAAAVLVAYLVLKRPGDVSNPDAPFEVEEAKEVRTENWPLYGFNPERTRYLPAKKLKPPFKVTWKFKAEALLEYSPIVVDGTIYGLNNNGLAFAVDAGTGKARWKREVAALNASAPTYSGGRLYMANLEPGQAQALDADTGKTVWRRSLPGRTESSPVVVGDRVILGCECGTLFALDAKTGKSVWETDLAGEVKAAPAFQDGVVYVGDYGSQLSAVRASSGEIKWQSGSQGLGLGQSGRFYASPAVAYDRVYVGNVDGRMYSYERDSGALAWSQSTGNYVYAAPVVADTPDTQPTVYFGSYDGQFYALDARSGAVRWQQAAGGAVSGAASLVGEVVYVANLAKTRTIGFRARDGKRLFNFKDGAYNPVISDGQRLYVTGYETIYALKPISKREAARLEKKGKGGK